MTTELTPAEQAAVEAIEGWVESPTEDGYATWIEHDEDLARTVVAAARRHIAAETLREAAENLTYALDEDEDHIAGIADAHSQLMRRADEILKGTDHG